MIREEVKFQVMRARDAAALVAMMAMASPMFAFAQATGGEDFDPAPLLLKVAAFVTGAGLLAAAIIAGRWGLHLWSLARPKH